MPTKYGPLQTLHIGRRAAENALHAVRYARDAGRPINTHVTISFAALSLDDDQAADLFRHLQARIGRWWRDQRTRKQRPVGDLYGFHSHANPAGSRHVHWLLHVPSEVAEEFARVLRNRLVKLTDEANLDEALHIGPVTTPGSLAKYVLRGIEPAYGGYLHIDAANEWLVSGCRRTGVSRAASKAARTRAGWKRTRSARSPSP